MHTSAPEPSSSTAASDSPRSARLIGAALLLLGVLTMAGWLLQVRAMVDIVQGLVPMVFNTGLGFALAGSALLARAARARALLGAAMLVLFGATLAEHLFDISLGIDLAPVHHWFDYGNTRPGRMAPNSALGFMLIGALHLRLARIDSRGAAYTAVLLTFCLLSIGLTGLVAYLLEPDLLFGWSRSARMALHTAGGMILASFGIWVGWSRSAWFTGTRFFTEAAKLRFLGTAILFVVTTTVGLTGVVLMQQSLKRAIEGRLVTVAQSRGPWLLTTAGEMARHGRAETALAGVPADALAALAGSASGFDAAARRLLAAGYQQVALEDAQGRVILSHGVSHGASDALVQFRAVLDGDDTQLLWNGAPTLRMHQPLLRDGQLLGRLRLDRSLRAVERALFDVSALGRTAELVACSLEGALLTCLPNARGGAVLRIDLRHRPATRKLPIEHALAGATGVVYTLDHRDHNVVAAHAPIVRGFGLVAKQDTLEAYAVIRAALAWGVPLILVISALGACALYSQTAPLVARMRASERQAEQAAAETRSLMQAVGEGIMTIDGRGTIRSINPAACRIFCYREEELYGQPVSQLVPERLRAAHEQGLSRAAAGGPPRLIGGPPVTVEGLRKDGSQFPLELTLTSVTVGNERRFVGVVRDITERQAMERQLEHMAQYDSLTGLANRRLFMERLRIALARGKRHGDAVAVLFIDLDGFKQVNDTLGHAAGDALLVEVARRMTSAVRATDTVARLGGDEFTLILEDMQAPAHQAEVVANKLLEHLWRPFKLAEGSVCIGASIGLMVHDCVAGPGDVDEILRAADARMYAAKMAGKNRVVSAL